MSYKFRYFFGICILLIAFNLSGCSFVPSLNLTESEEQQVVGYIADLMLKHDRSFTSDIVDTTAARELEARVEAVKELNAQAEEAKDSSEDNDFTEGMDPEMEAAINSLQYPPEGEQDVAWALEQYDFSVMYTGYEVCQSYPHDGSAGDYFAMDATMGKQLIVFHFDVLNIGQGEKECDFLTHDPIFRIVVNDQERLNALTTLLTNDLATLQVTLQPGEHSDAVLVLETEPGFENEIITLSLLMKYNGQQSVIPLQ